MTEKHKNQLLPVFPSMVPPPRPEIREYSATGPMGCLVSATLTGPCGDTMRFDLHIEDECVRDTYFWGDGCFHSRQCGRLVAETAKGKSVDDLPGISPEFISDHLNEPLPPEEDHCAQLAHETLMEALDKYFKYSRKTKRIPEVIP